MNRQPATKEDIIRAITPVLEQGGALKAILFGSYARGDADEFSDLDLIIVAESQRPFVERFKDFMGLWHVSPVMPLNVFVYTAAELEDMEARGNPFIAEAMEEGEVIYAARSRPGSPPMAKPGRGRPGRR